MSLPEPPPEVESKEGDGLQRHFGLLHATALNVTMIVGAGVFVTIPLMLQSLPGPYALWGWVAAGVLMLMDGLIWSELGAMMPGSGGSYLYLLESYGRHRWGRLMAFLFIWQFLLSGPLEAASGVISMSMFVNALSTDFAQFNEHWTRTLDLWPEQKLAVVFGPSRLVMVGIVVVILVLLYRRITTLGRLTVTFWIGVLGVIAWILIEGGLRFDPAIAFDFRGKAATWPADFHWSLGAAMLLATYSYLGYYHICYIGDEVRDPQRTIPWSILLSTLLVAVLFASLHLAMLGTVSWHDVPTDEKEMEQFSLAAEFMGKIHGHWAVVLVTLLLIWSSFGSTFAALLGYSRIPYGAARFGHFFGALARVHPVHKIPHLSLLLVGGLTLFWSFFDLGNVINALITTRIFAQFIAQIFAVVLLRRLYPARQRPFKVWLYPLPCGLALVGWLYMYVTAGWFFIIFVQVTLAAGVLAFLLWSYRAGRWPFGVPSLEKSD